ncbi:MAG: tRNA (adenosine(37)-N6)-threonylcarbamoyltransferase complex ATPase subunit type 1 TsaE [Actinomycetota bacterium]
MDRRAATEPGPVRADEAPVVLCVATDGPEATRALAAALAPLLSDGDLLVLTGDLGAGKTCFTQGLGVGLGVDERITSPTFTLVAEYEGRLRLHHLDVYRLDGPGDTGDLDLHELAEEGVTVVEWGERIDPVLGADRLLIELTFPDLGQDGESGDDDRLLRIEPVGERWRARAEAMASALGPWAVPC